MQKIRWFFLILAIVLVIAMAVQNNELATVSLFWLEAEMPLSVLLLLTTGIGFLLGALMTASMLRSRRKKEKERQSKAVPSQEADPKSASEAEKHAASELGA